MSLRGDRPRGRLILLAEPGLDGIMLALLSLDMNLYAERSVPFDERVILVSIVGDERDLAPQGRSCVAVQVF